MRTRTKIIRPATSKDILNEILRRGFFDDIPVWTTKAGEKIKVRELSDEHLLNIYRMLRRQKEEDICDHEGDMSPMDYYD